MSKEKSAKKELAKKVLAADAAYERKEDDLDFPSQVDELFPDGGRLLFSEEFEETAEHKFRATAFLDKENKKLTYAIAGTRADQGSGKAIADLFDDFLLAIGKKPKKIDPLKKFNDKVLEMVPPSQLKNYDINFTGHSLGAVLSDYAAADMYLKMKDGGTNLPQISSTTFDNPGARRLVKKRCKEAGAKIDDLTKDVEYKAFNNRKNFINTLNKQVGEKYTIVPDRQEKVSGFHLMCGWLAKRCPIPVVRRFFKYLSFGKIAQQLAEHSLKNFDNVLVKNKGKVKKDGRLMTVEEAATGIETLEYDQELFNKLQELDHNNVQKNQFSMESPDGNRVECSKGQLANIMLKAMPQQTKMKITDRITSIIKSKKQKLTGKIGKFYVKTKLQKYKKRRASDVIQSLKRGI